MKATLLSIHKHHSEKIFENTKKIEWRKKPLPKGRIYIYETKKNGGSGKIVGYVFSIHHKRYDYISQISDQYISLGAISRKELARYAQGKPLYAHFILFAAKFNEPKELKEFNSYKTCKPIQKPPQSFMYIDDKGGIVE